MSRFQKWIIIGSSAFLVLFMVIQFAVVFSPQIVESRILEGDIKGSTLYFKGTPYTLNFNQQKWIVGQVQLAPEFNGDLSGLEPDQLFEKIVLHRFEVGNGGDWILVSAGYLAEKKVEIMGVSCGEKRFFIEVPTDALIDWLQTAHD
jgi:hypothetical protein